MLIKDIQVEKVDLELTRPYSIAFKSVHAVENVIVKITASDGTFGLGAGNPSKEVVGESIEDTLSALNPDSLPWLAGRNAFHYQQLCDEISERLPGRPAARAALDIALHDLVSKKLDMPLVAFLGQKIKALPTSITIGIKGVEESLEEAREYLERGFRILKVKLGKSMEEDLERLIKIRETVGKDVLIRIDANQGYTFDEVHRFYRETTSLDLELIEQPLPAGAMAEMKKLPEEIKEKIAADESLLGPSEAFALAASPRACGIFNIKLMKCGGISRAREIAMVAKHSGIDLMWGCNDESIISISAALHTAFSCAKTRYIDLDGSLDLARDVVEGGFVVKDGVMSVGPGAGLGLAPLRMAST